MSGAEEPYHAGQKLYLNINLIVIALGNFGFFWMDVDGMNC